MKESLKDLSLPLIFVGIPILVLVLIIVMHTEPNRYVGTVMKVSSWDGAASLKTKNKRGQDTIIEVKPRRFERFTEGQIITVWTGGDLIGDIATTNPQ
jgi:hypothetical protein